MTIANLPYPAHTASLEIDGIILPVKADPDHEWTLSTEQVAIGYEVTPANLRKHKERHSDELSEGAHWVVTISHTPGGNQQVVHWTKLGVITLGFFIKSERAKRFRRMAAELILRLQEQSEAPPLPPPPAAAPDGLALIADSIRQMASVMDRMVSCQQAMIESPERQAQQHLALAEIELARVFRMSQGEYGRWERFAIEIATQHVPVNTERAFTCAELMALGAPVSIHGIRPEVAIGLRMMHLAERELPGREGRVVHWRHRRTTHARLWVCRHDWEFAALH
jgi:hypothetical protein